MDFLLTPNPGLVIWTTFTFGVLFFLLRKFAWRPILQALKVREETIEYSLKAAEKAKADVVDMVNERNKLIEEAKKERDELLKETRALKDSIIAEAKNSAQKEAKQIMTLAKKQIEQEKSSAISQLKSKVAELSVEIAGMIIEKEYRPDEKQKELINKYLDEVNFN